MRKVETGIQTAIQHYVQLSGGVCMKVHGSAIQGSAWPDLIGGIDGQPFAVEVKTPDGTPTRSQLAVLKLFEVQGYVTGVISSTTEFERLFNCGHSNV